MGSEVIGSLGFRGRSAEDRWRRAREEMVENQIVARGISDERVLSAMKRVPRHAFVPEAFAHDAYADMALPIGHGQTISQPYMVALSLEALRPRGGEKVLEIGAGSGYVTALLAELAESVRAIERIPELAISARSRLEKLGYTNFLLWAADGTYGWAEEAPFDAILSAAASKAPPKTWMAQLAPAGRLVMPVGNELGQQLVRYVSGPDGRIQGPEFLAHCVFVKLVGEYGWPEK